MNKSLRSFVSLRPRASCLGLTLSILSLVGCSTEEFEEDALPDEHRMQAQESFVTPILECVEDNGNGTYEATWSYVNIGPKKERIKVGKRNKFKKSGGKDQGQPEVFKKGYRTGKVHTVHDAGDVPGWKLGNNIAWASQDMRDCSQDRSAFDQLGRPVDENWHLIEPCADLSCGDPCTICGDGPTANGTSCLESHQAKYCNPQGECVGGAPSMSCGND